ncbi:MAG: PIG-L family deacetylase [Verrucomicrobiae bacterium]|nr:PIG-L family deacetylase [Verrucomicrobiae bacterium]
MARRTPASPFELFVPDRQPGPKALARTTDLGVGAHQDDLEFMCAAPILECLGDSKRWFCGVVVTDGAGSARASKYAGCGNAEMRKIRAEEQRKAASIGRYGALAALGLPSAAIKKPGGGKLVPLLTEVLRKTSPERVFTHNPADKHDTHVAVCVAVVDAIRALPRSKRPRALYGCEVWRSLDWLSDSEKKRFDVGGHEHLLLSLMGVFDSQIAGGKRYDLATLGRKRANATFDESHAVDKSTAVELALDMTALLRDDNLSIERFIDRHLEKFRADVHARIRKHVKPWK